MPKRIIVVLRFKSRSTLKFNIKLTYPMSKKMLFDLLKVVVGAVLGYLSQVL